MSGLTAEELARQAQTTPEQIERFRARIRDTLPAG